MSKKQPTKHCWLGRTDDDAYALGSSRASWKQTRVWLWNGNGPLTGNYAFHGRTIMEFCKEEFERFTNIKDMKVGEVRKVRIEIKAA